MNLAEIEDLVRLYGSQLYRFCLKLTPRQADAEDLYQESFVKLAENIHKVDRDKNPKSYLFSLAIYIWKSNCRKYARRQRIAPVVDMDGTERQPDDLNLENTFLDKELCDFMNESIRQLPAKFKIPIILYYTSEMSVEEIAAVLKIPKGTVKSRMHKARQTLKKRLEAAGYE